MMKVWIIYDNGRGHCKKLAAILEDLLEGDFDVSVGDAKKISPEDVLNEGPDAVLIGGPLHLGKPSRGICSWVKGCFALTRAKSVKVGKAFTFTTGPNSRGNERSWQKLFQQFPFAMDRFPKVLFVKIKRESEQFKLELNQGVYDDIEQLRNYLLKEQTR